MSWSLRGLDVFFVLPLLLLLILCRPIPLIAVDVDGGEGTRNFPGKLAVGDIVHVATGEKVSFSQLMDFIEETRIVYVGEVHTNAESHEVQLQLLREFYDKYGDDVAIGMEMFKRPYQAVLDRWSRGEITEEELLEGSRWEQEWGYDYDLYNDILDFARKKKIPIIALSVSKELQKKVSRGGLDGLSYSDRRKLPAIDTSDKYHRRYLQKIFKGHMDRGGDFEKFYDVQCVWEDVMADSISRYLLSPEGKDKRFLAFLGDSHIVYHFGVPKRVFRSTHLPYATVYTYELMPEEPDDEDDDGEKDKDEEHGLFLDDIPLQPADFVRVIHPARRQEKRAVLGVMVRDIESDKVVIQDVLKGSPAELAGLQVGDIVLSMDGQRMKEVQDVILHLHGKKLEEKCNMEISREGRKQLVEVSFFEFERG
ncbi:MAG: ChaN family lipoprotein [Planctomycetota bacterium]